MKTCAANTLVRRQTSKYVGFGLRHQQNPAHPKTKICVDGTNTTRARNCGSTAKYKVSPNPKPPSLSHVLFMIVIFHLSSPKDSQGVVNASRTGEMTQRGTGGSCTKHEHNCTLDAEGKPPKAGNLIMRFKRIHPPTTRPITPKGCSRSSSRTLCCYIACECTCCKLDGDLVYGGGQRHRFSNFAEVPLSPVRFSRHLLVPAAGKEGALPRHAERPASRACTLQERGDGTRVSHGGSTTQRSRIIPLVR